MRNPWRITQFTRNFTRNFTPWDFYLFQWKQLIQCTIARNNGFWLQFHTQCRTEHGTMAGHQKKLIEVVLPLEAINKALAREKFPSQRYRSAATIAKFCCAEVRE